MLKKLKAIDLPFTTSNWRAILWIFLILLTGALLLYPVHLSYEGRPIQSAYIFDNLPLFAVLYCAWILLTLVLLYSLRKEDGAGWKKLILVLIFALVFAGFWATISHGYSREASVFAAEIETLGRDGGIPQPVYGYFSFPGLVILTSFLCQVTKLPAFDSIFLIIMVQILLFASLLFILFKNLLRSTFLASLAALLVIQGDIMMAKLLPQFHAGSFAILYFILFLILISKRERPLFRSWENMLILAILVFAVTITHFVTSYAFILVLAGIFLVQMISRKKEALSTIPLIILCLVVPLVWGNVYAGEVSQGVLSLVPEAAERLPEVVGPEAVGPEELLFSGYAMGLARAHLGSAVPLWARVTKIFWVMLIVLFGSILGLRNLFRPKNLNFTQKKVIGGFVGIVLLGIVTLLLARAEETFRFLTYIPFFTVPLFVSFFFSPKNLARGILPGLLIILFLVFSFPAFLAHNDTIVTDTYSPHELASGEFLRSNYGYGQGLHIFSYNEFPINYFVPNACIERPMLQRARVNDLERRYWNQLDTIMSNFQDSEGDAVFVSVDRRVIFPFQHFLAVDPTTRLEWGELQARLSQQNLIFNNGDVQIYPKD